MVYENYQSGKRKDTSDDVGEPVAPVMHSNKRHATDPFAKYDEHYVDDPPKAPRFSPPAYIQRYMAVQAVLADPKYEGKIKKVVDFGCSELGFIVHLKNTSDIEEIICVDVDRETLNTHKSKAMPLNADYLHTRPNPLSIRIYEGSVTHRDKKLANSDAVVAIELIEHLYPDTLMDLPHNIFGYIRPLVVAITTPNADFNVLFGSMENEMRHWDHKFEWTRQQFEDWSNNIVSRYPDYQVSFQGIGPGPAGTEHLGCCSQMAVFNRIGESTSIPVHGIDGLFKLVISQEYPHRVDNRSDEQKILDEASYYIRQFAHNDPDCENGYPLPTLLRQLDKFFITAETLREVLENAGYAIVERSNVATILCPALSTFSDYDDDITSVNNDDDWENVRVPDNPSYDRDFGNWNDDAAERNYDECWDDDYEIPAENTRNTDEIQVNEESNYRGTVEFEFSVTRSLDTGDFNAMEISNLSHIPSIRDSIEPNGFSGFLESFESNDDNDPDPPKVTTNISINSSSNSDEHRGVDRDNVTAIVGEESNVSTSENPKNVAIVKIANDEELKNEDSRELASLCSIYLESSRNDDRDSCPTNITNPNFDCASLERSFEESKKILSDDSSPDSSLKKKFVKSSNDDGRSSSSSIVRIVDVVTRPQYTSSPRGHIDLDKNVRLQKFDVPHDRVDGTKNVSQSSLSSNGNVSTTTITDLNSGILKKLFTTNDVVPDDVESKESNETIDDCEKRIIASGSGEQSCSDGSERQIPSRRGLRATGSSRNRAPESLDLGMTKKFKSKECLTMIEEPSTCSNESTTNFSRTNDVVDATTRSSRHVVGIVRENDEIPATSTERNNFEKNDESKRWRTVEIHENGEAKRISPDAPDTPPNSWSPEIMDSGYPNSSSTQDMTPEYDLSSIAQDRDSDSESPSVAEIPRLAFVDHRDVENGDLANNNRDDEGNNMMAHVENDLDDDLQPLIDVLENDLENENDIYGLENGFPVWLLRILERGNAAGRNVVGIERIDRDDERLVIDVNAAGDAGMPDLDEGFDGTSSDEDNVDEVSTESSEENIDWNASGDYYN